MTSPRIQALVEQFVSDITAAITEDMTGAIMGALGGAGPVRRGRKPGPKAARSATPRRGGKRTAEALEAQTKALLGAIKKAPASRIEQIAKAMGVPTKELALPIKKLLADKAITRKGQRRATAYTAK